MNGQTEDEPRSDVSGMYYGPYGEQLEDQEQCKVEGSAGGAHEQGQRVAEPNGNVEVSVPFAMGLRVLGVYNRPHDEACNDIQ